MWRLQLGWVPATLTGSERSVKYNGKRCRFLKWLEDTMRLQVQLENGRLLAVESKNVRPEIIATPFLRGAIGKKEGMKNKGKVSL